MALGALDCDSGQASEAETLAREARQEFQAERESDNEIQSETLLSRSLLQQGKFGAAQESMAGALALSKKSGDITVRLPLAIQHAYTLAAAKDLSEAERLARNVLVESTRLGMVQIELEASLAIGEIQLQGKNPDLVANGLRRRGKSHIHGVSSLSHGKQVLHDEQPSVRRCRERFWAGFLDPSWRES